MLLAHIVFVVLPILPIMSGGLGLLAHILARFK